ncbi:MAG TPA: ribonuclease D [Nostocaceae cyanobacterium]|nr:ribonuclease D [Nostocaceae cyanobacterium]
MPYLTSPLDISNLVTKYTQAPTLWIDTEVADFKNRPKLSLIQVLDDPQDMSGDRVYILDVLDQPDVIADFINRIMINPNIEKVFHNAKFDIKLLGDKKAKNVTCTLEMAKNIPYYILPLPNYQLQTLATELCRFNSIDKHEQTSDWGIRPLTEDQIEYAYLDCIYLAQVHLRLLALQTKINPEPETEALDELTARFIELEQEQKILNSEYEHIKERVKKAMEAQNIKENAYCKLSSYERKTIKTQFTELVKLVETQKINLDFPVTLTDKMRKELGGYLEQLDIEIEKTTYSRLTAKNQEGESTDE